MAESERKGPMRWIDNQIASGINARALFTQLLPNVKLPGHVDDVTIWKLIWELITEPPPREKRVDVNTLDDALRLIKASSNILILTGAGVSVSCGIPDFRSRDGIYARLSQDFPDLPNPQSMFDIHYFKHDQRPFYKFAKELYPGHFKPSLSHRFIAAVEQNGKLLRNYSQNIDTLEDAAGITRSIQCHGSFATSSCTNCKYQVDAEVIRQNIFDQKIPLCPNCPQDENTLCVMKPDIVFFGEGLPNEFYKELEDDKDKADLLIVIGSSLKVRPVSLIPNYINPDIPQILINRESLAHMNFDIELLGNCDAIICEICKRLGPSWRHIIQDYVMPQLDKNILFAHFEMDSSSQTSHTEEDVVDDDEYPYIDHDDDPNDDAVEVDKDKLSDNDDHNDDNDLGDDDDYDVPTWFEMNEDNQKDMKDCILHQLITVSNRPTGISGVDGVHGVHGISGVDGVHGISGVDGVHGISGVDGVHGISGVDGVHGISGVDGVHGISGVDGVHAVHGDLISHSINEDDLDNPTERNFSMESIRLADGSTLPEHVYSDETLVLEDISGRPLRPLKPEYPQLTIKASNVTSKSDQIKEQLETEDSFPFSKYGGMKDPAKITIKLTEKYVQPDLLLVKPGQNDLIAVPPDTLGSDETGRETGNIDIFDDEHPCPVIKKTKLDSSYKCSSIEGTSEDGVNKRDTSQNADTKQSDQHNTHNKNGKMENDENMYYIHIPPNRYIFHGAELCDYSSS